MFFLPTALFTSTRSSFLVLRVKGKMFGRATTAARKRFKFPPPPQTSADQRGSLPRRAPTNSLIAPRQLQMSNEKKLIPIPSTSLEAQRYFGLQNRQKRELIGVPERAVASLVSAACAIAASVSDGYTTLVRSFANNIRPQDMTLEPDFCARSVEGAEV